ncbi:MAG TPA: penicillin-binding protein 1C [Chitinophagaceae bacterium]
MKKLVGYIRHLPRTTKLKYLLWLVVFAWFWLLLPGNLFNSPTSFIITDRNGQLLNASIAADGQWRFPGNDTVPEKFIACITAFEDKRFFYHPGIDPFAMSRAVYQNITSKKVVSGGSTLTMQVIRMSKKHEKRTLWNKLTESVLALRLEMTHSKKEILSLYASNAPFGSNVVGIDAAAWRYYGRSPAALTWGEMAALAVLPNAPSLVHPGRNRSALLKKRNELLKKLVTSGTIDVTTAKLAMLEPLPLAPQTLPQIAPHLAERFKRDYRKRRAAGEQLATGIRTTIDMNLQQQVNAILETHHAQLMGNQVNNMAAMVVEINSGNILAYAGNIFHPSEPELQSHVDILSSVRSPGSTLKPLLYASLLTEGYLLPRQLVPDIPTQIGGFTPENFDLSYDGAVPANQAISRSLNIPAVRMLQQYKYQRFYDRLKQLGFTSLNRAADDYGMSLILGGCEISPFELAGVYSSMARMYMNQKKNNGEWNSADWKMPAYVEGNCSPIHITSPLFDYTAIWHTFNAMNEVARPGEEGFWGLFTSAQRIAWKTGTSFGFRDAWAIGVTKKYCVLVWVGNASGEGRPGLTGTQAAAPVLFEIFRLLPASEWFDAPVEQSYISVCRISGFKAGSECRETTKMLVSPAARNNSTVCPYHRIVHLDHTARYRVTENCESPADMQHRSWFVLPPTMEFYYRQRHADYKPLPDYLPGCASNTETSIDVVYPEENARIYIPLEVTGERGRSIFTATHRKQESTLFWHLDNEYAGSTRQFHQLAFSPAPGKHVLTVVDEHGERVTRHFEILQKEKN